jgi:hypothetical protein
LPLAIACSDKRVACSSFAQQCGRDVTCDLALSSALLFLPFAFFLAVATIVRWFLKQFMRIMPGPVLEWIINRSTERIRKAANAICLKDYSSFLR